MGGKRGRDLGAKHVFQRVGPTSGMGKRNIILLHQFGKILKRYFPHLNSGKLSNCTVEEHYCISEVSRK